MNATAAHDHGSLTDLRKHQHGHELQLPYLGINEGTLGNWVSTAKKSGKVVNKPLDIDERARLKELEEENRRLKMERDFLKKGVPRTLEVA